MLFFELLRKQVTVHGLRLNSLIEIEVPIQERGNSLSPSLTKQRIPNLESNLCNCTQLVCAAL